MQKPPLVKTQFFERRPLVCQYMMEWLYTHDSTCTQSTIDNHLVNSSIADIQLEIDALTKETGIVYTPFGQTPPPVSAIPTVTREQNQAKQLMWVSKRLPNDLRHLKDEYIEMLRNNPWMLDDEVKDIERRTGDKYQSLPEIIQGRLERKARKAALKRERAERDVLKHVEFVVIDGKLHRQEYWGPRNIWDKNLDKARPPIPCGKRVMIRGKQRTSALVVHEILTGKRVKNLPRTPSRGPAKPYQARIYINGVRTHIGYYATPEERDTAQALAKIGIYPEGFEVRHD